jgi:hypothetical protein
MRDLESDHYEVVFTKWYLRSGIYEVVFTKWYLQSDHYKVIITKWGAIDQGYNSPLRGNTDERLGSVVDHRVWLFPGYIVP